MQRARWKSRNKEKKRRGWSTKNAQCNQQRRPGQEMLQPPRKQKREAIIRTTVNNTLKDQEFTNYFKKIPVQAPNDTIRTPLAGELATAPMRLKTFEEDVALTALRGGEHWGVRSESESCFAEPTPETCKHPGDRKRHEAPKESHRKRNQRERA